MASRAAALAIASALVVGCGAVTAPAERDAGAPIDVGASDAGTTDAGPAIDAGACGAGLCGGGTCSATIDEDVWPAMSNNDTASIALDANGRPAMLVELPSPTYEAVLSRRVGPGAWRTTRLPTPAATGSLARGVPGPIALVAYDGAFGSTLWSEGGDSVVLTGTIPTDESFRASSLWRDARGVIHMLGDGGSGRSPMPPTYFRYDGAFHGVTLGASTARTSGGRIALSDSGIAWASWVELGASAADPHRVHVWRGDTGSDDTAASVSGGAVSMVVRTAPTGEEQPVLLLWDPPATPLSAAVRSPSGTWSRHTLVDDMGPLACHGGCTLDPRSAVLVTRGGEVRVLFAANRTEPTGASALLLIMPVDGTVDAAETNFTHTGMRITGVQAIVDDCGTIHVAYEEGPTGTEGQHARYLALGAR
jgi:hypothetical protein